MSRAPLIGLTCSSGGSPGSSWAGNVGTHTSYTLAVERAGGVPILLPNTGAGLAERMLEPLDGLLLTGGDDVHPLLFGCEPEQGLGEVDTLRDAFELPLIRLAMSRRRPLPILGICRGIQAFNAALGGTLIQDLKSLTPPRLQHQMHATQSTVQHTVTLAPDSRLAAILGCEQLAVCSYHHQAVDQPAPGLVVTARAADGTVEGLELPGDRFIVMVQWHPEVMPADHEPSRKLFAAFIEACAAEPRSAAAPR